MIKPDFFYQMMYMSYIFYKHPLPCSVQFPYRWRP